MSQSTQSSNKKSSFPPRKQTTAVSQTKPSNYEECIKNYQQGIKALKGRILDLERRLENPDEIDSEIIQLYKFAQVEWNKISEENTQLNKIISKGKNQDQLSHQKDTDNKLTSSNLSLYSENQRLHSELKKKDSIIQSMLKETFTSSTAENQVKSLIDENIKLKSELENANLALTLNNNFTALDTFNKILLEKQQSKTEPNEALRLAQEENKALRDQIQELESEIYEISNNNPELQASLEAEKQLRKLNKELEEKIYNLELQLKSKNKQSNNEQTHKKKEEVMKNPNHQKSNIQKLLEDEDDFDRDFENDDMNALDDDFLPLKNTSDEDDEDEDESATRKRKNDKKEFEFSDDMKMFSAILGPLKKRLDERVRQVEIERMKKEGAFAPLKITGEEDTNEKESNLGIELLTDQVQDKKSKVDSNENNNN